MTSQYHECTHEWPIEPFTLAEVSLAPPVKPDRFTDLLIVRLCVQGKEKAF